MPKTFNPGSFYDVNPLPDIYDDAIASDLATAERDPALPARILLDIGNAYLSTIPGSGWQLPFNGNGFLSLQYTAVVSSVPEPGPFALLLAGLGLVSVVAKRRR